jgi:hypothetical protein
MLARGPNGAVTTPRAPRCSTETIRPRFSITASPGAGCATDSHGCLAAAAAPPAAAATLLTRAPACRRRPGHCAAHAPGGETASFGSSDSSSGDSSAGERRWRVRRARDADAEAVGRICGEVGARVRLYNGDGCRLTLRVQGRSSCSRPRVLLTNRPPPPDPPQAFAAAHANATPRAPARRRPRPRTLRPSGWAPCLGLRTAPSFQSWSSAMPPPSPGKSPRSCAPRSPPRPRCGAAPGVHHGSASAPPESGRAANRGLPWD